MAQREGWENRDDQSQQIKDPKVVRLTQISFSLVDDDTNTVFKCIQADLSMIKVAQRQ